VFDVYQVLYFELLDTNVLYLGRALPRVSFWTTDNITRYEILDQNPEGQHVYGVHKVCCLRKLLIEPRGM
jgi:hypothetical protein